ncbi:hypothetical protein [Stenomitos frigidus]|uniref:Uncharacterized protein n=1 Tax=Stenomitos frigidus ULC18 TaxID=2107698 RepID=A0A2T1DZR4_9CYAN|nr:hypothetical protein [Stenomitos frigidus]PSB25988.1 hypothetical protein C7B82_21025 [Stenomitos frigidus ULC18]
MIDSDKYLSKYFNPVETDQALELMQVLDTIFQYEFGWLLSGKRVEHQNSEYREEAQNQVNGLTQGVLLVYLFAIFDDYTTEKMRGEWLTADEKKLLKAYRHIRNGVAHKHGGKRAKTWRNEFESIMSSDQAFSNAGLVWDREADTIDLTKAQVALPCHTMMRDLAQKLAARLASDKKP